LGAHIGFAPKLKSGESLDLEDSRTDNIEYAGAGEMGLIMLDFQWNAMMNSKGYGELGKPMYDRKMWDGEVFGMGAPSLRDVTSIAAAIAGKFIPGADFVDDLLFAGLDITHGYKSVGEVATSLVITAATSLIPGGDSGASGITGIMKNAGIAAVKSYGINVASSYIGAINFDKIGTDDWIDDDRLEAANGSWYSAKTIAGAVGAGVSAGVGSAFGGLTAADSKFLGGAVKLGTAMAGETAKYGVYAGYSLDAEDWSDGNVLGHIGSALGRAYDDMGGLTINVANLGAILDFAGSAIARNNGAGQSIFGDGSILQSLSDVGLLEVNIGLDGVSSRIGMGGVDVGGAVYDLAKRGIDYAALKSYATGHSIEQAEMAWNTYVYGDFTQENTAARITSGKDELEIVRGGKGTKLGETRSNGNGGRLIEIADTGDINTMSVTLGHEAYRDGVVGGNNRSETRNAVIAHTEMAARMRAEGAEFGGIVGLDLAMYDYARSAGNMDIMANYADSLYDSSGEYLAPQVVGAIIGFASSNATEIGGRMISGQEFFEAVVDTYSSKEARINIGISTGMGALTSGLSSVGVKTATEAIKMSAGIGVNTVTKEAITTVIINTISGGVDAGGKDVLIKLATNKEQNLLETAKEMGKGAGAALMWSTLTQGIINRGTKISNYTYNGIERYNPHTPEWSGKAGLFGESIIPALVDTTLKIFGKSKEKQN
jgi:hypothetical protein